MTSPLRRKHPITRRSIRPAKTADAPPRALALPLPDQRLGALCWLALLLATALVALAWLPAARADDSDSPPVSPQTWTRPLRRSATPPPAIVGTNVVSSRAESATAAGRQSQQQNPLDRFDWGDLGLADKPPSVPQATGAVMQTQALLPANDSAPPSGATPAAIEPQADEPRQLDLPASGDAAPGEERLAQLPKGPSVPPLDSFGQGLQSLEVNCDIERQKLKPINAVTNKITAEPGAFPPECGIGDLPFKTRDFPPMTYTWIASNLCHKPLYFEQPRLERYGHSLPPVIQPLVSGLQFFLTVPLLPYKMGIEPPNECIYVLGYYRPSSCAPMQIPGVALSLRGAIFEAAMITGFAVVLPP